MLFFDNEDIGSPNRFAAAEFERSDLSSSARSLVHQKAQGAVSTLPGQISGGEFHERLREHLSGSIGSSFGADRTCPAGEEWDTIDNVCRPAAPTKSQPRLRTGLQTFVATAEAPKIQNTVVRVPLTSEPSKNSLVPTPSFAPPPVVVNTPKPVSVVSSGPALAPSLPSFQPSTASDLQPQFVSLEPAAETGFLDKSIVGKFKVKHALIGGAVSLVGVFAFRALR